MTSDQYVEAILRNYEVPRGPNSPAEKLGAFVAGPISTWANRYLNSLEYSGSYAKTTGIRGVSDIDLLISLKSSTPDSLQDIYSSLYDLALKNGWSPRAQNVSIRITLNGTNADLVPGKVQAGYRDYHSLYLRKQNSWTQTNVNKHIQDVRNSNRIKEIRAIKIWRYLHRVEFPSLYLELFSIRAISGHSLTTLADNVLHILRFIASSLTTTRIIDPANTNNVISNELTAAEKSHIASLASQSAGQQSWGSVIW